MEANFISAADLCNRAALRAHAYPGLAGEPASPAAVEN